MARNRLLIEAAIVIAVVVGIWAIVYSPLLGNCCGAADIVVIGVLWSASRVGGFLTGDLRDPGRGAVVLGLIIEALVAWALFRWGVRRLGKGKKNIDPL